MCKLMDKKIFTILRQIFGLSRPLTIHAWSLSVSEVTYEKVTAFLPQLLSKLYIEGLVYGNITKQVGDDVHVTTGNL